MKLITQNLNYTELVKNRTSAGSGGDQHFNIEMWDNIENSNNRLMIILKPNTKEPVAAISFFPYRYTSGLLYERIKKGLLLQEPLDQEEKKNVAGIANHLTKYGSISVKTKKLNWTLQMLDETFALRVKVRKDVEESYYFERR